MSRSERISFNHTKVMCIDIKKRKDDLIYDSHIEVQVERWNTIFFSNFIVPAEYE